MGLASRRQAAVGIQEDIAAYQTSPDGETTNSMRRACYPIAEYRDFSLAMNTDRS